MSDVAVAAGSPGWLGLGWTGSGAVAGAAVAVVLAAAAGVPVSRLSDPGPDGVGFELGPVLGTVLAAAFLLPAGVAVGAAVGAGLRTLDRYGRSDPPWPAVTGFGIGVAVLLVLVTLMMVAVDPSADPGLPSTVVLVPAGAAGLVGAGLGHLMARAAARRSRPC